MSRGQLKHAEQEWAARPYREPPEPPKREGLEPAVIALLCGLVIVLSVTAFNFGR